MALTGTATNRLGLKTFASGDRPDLYSNPGGLSEILAQLDTLGACCRAYHTLDQSTANATETTLAFNSERFDTDTIHDTATNNSRLTCRSAGKYQITAFVTWGANATGNRYISIHLNGGAVAIAAMRQLPVAGQETEMDLPTLYSLAVGDYLEVHAYQTSGGALNVRLNAEFMMARVG